MSDDEEALLLKVILDDPSCLGGLDSRAGVAALEGAWERATLPALEIEATDPERRRDCSVLGEAVTGSQPSKPTTRAEADRAGRVTLSLRPFCRKEASLEAASST